MRKDDPVRGPVDAKDTVVAFTGYVGADDAKFAEFVDSGLLKRLDGVRVVLKHFPMNAACNKGVKKGQAAPGACKAALAAEAARMHEITLADAEKLALALEFDIDTFFGTDITIQYQDLGAKNLKSFDYKNDQSKYMKAQKISKSDWERILD